MPRKKSHIPDNSAEHNRRTFEYYAKPNRYDRTLRDYRDRLKSKYSKAYDANAAMLRDEYSHEVKLLPNVKFIDPYTDPDVNSIRNADVVWMQTNAMPHSRYNKIMEIVRIKKIPAKYFAYASAEKCAVQVVEYDSASAE